MIFDLRKESDQANVFDGTLYQEGEDNGNDDILEAEHKTRLLFEINSLITVEINLTVV